MIEHLYQVCSAELADGLAALLTEQLQLFLLVLGAVKSFIEVCLQLAIHSVVFTYPYDGVI